MGTQRLGDKKKRRCESIAGVAFFVCLNGGHGDGQNFAECWTEEGDVYSVDYQNRTSHKHEYAPADSPTSPPSSWWENARAKGIENAWTKHRAEQSARWQVEREEAEREAAKRRRWGAEEEAMRGRGRDVGPSRH